MREGDSERRTSECESEKQRESGIGRYWSIFSFWCSQMTGQTKLDPIQPLTAVTLAFMAQTGQFKLVSDLSVNLTAVQFYKDCSLWAPKSVQCQLKLIRQCSQLYAWLDTIPRYTMSVPTASCHFLTPIANVIHWLATYKYVHLVSSKLLCLTFYMMSSILDK